MEGLEASVMPVKVVISDGTKTRIDSGYFSKKAIAAEETIDHLPNHRLDEITSTFRKGIFDIKADTYVRTNEGIPFVRIGDLKSGLIQKDSTAWISKRAHEREAKTALGFGDLAISKTAYPAASMINLRECNVSQDIIAIRLNAFGRMHYKAGFVAGFLNTTQGYELMRRRFQGNVQQHLSLEDGKAIRIPCFGLKLQSRVHEILEDADSKQDGSAASQERAERTLLQAVGLVAWNAPTSISHTARAQDVVAAARMDAQYFSSKFDEVFQRMLSSGADLKLVRDICFFNARGSQPKYAADGDVYVVNSRHILENAIDYENLERTTTEWLNANERARLKCGDIITYTTGAKIGRTAHFSLDGPAIASNHVNILRLNEGNPIYVAFVINSLVGRLQTERHLKGSAQPELYPGDIDKFVVPFTSEEVQTSIAEDLQLGEKLGVHGRQLFETAKCAVEIAIELDEDAANAFLDRSENKS